MNRRHLIVYITLLFITGLGLFLRLYKLADVPPGLNRDEAAIGFTAYSLLKTGADEYGKSWPLSFKSFGDWKVPVYFYLDLPVIALMGLTETATRLPSALLGTLTVLLTFFLVKEMLGREFGRSSFIVLVSLLSALCLSVSPWHLFASRNASEANVAVFLITAGLLLFFKSFQKPILLTLGFFSLAFSLYTYHGNHIFTPLLFLVLLVIYWKQLRQNRWFGISLIIFVGLAVLIFSQTLFGADKTKISGLFPLNDEAKLYELVVLRRLEAPPSLLNTLLHSKPVYLILTVAANYLKGLSPEFLFISGGTNLQHNIPEFGNLFIWEAITIPLALFVLLSKGKQSGKFLLFWLLIAPLAGSITKDAPHTNRELSMLPLPAILSGFGLGVIWLWIKNKRWFFIGAGLIVTVLAFNLVVYLEKYYVHFPYVSEKDWGKPYEKMMQKVIEYKNQYAGITVSRPDYSPYIYYLFYQKSDPYKVQTQMLHYPETSEGFEHVKEFDGISYKKIDWTDELLIPDQLYVDWVESVPWNATNSGIIINPKILLQLQQNGVETDELLIGDQVVSSIKDEVVGPDGNPIFLFIETKKITARSIENTPTL